MQTEVDLLLQAITDKTRTKEAFAQLLGMSRQNLNNIINKAKKDEGYLPPKFVRTLKDSYQIDINQYIKRDPTFDFHSATELESMKKIMMAAEPERPYMTRKMFDHLIDENTDLRNRLRECEQARDIAEKKRGRSSG